MLAFCVDQDHNMSQRLDLYLKRIGFTGSPAPDLATLAALQERHLQAVPFENLNPLLGLRVGLEEDTLTGKLLRDGRGGYCFEHNLLFLDMLREIGFTARGVTGRVYWNQPEGAQPARSHMLLIVTIDGEEYLSDVGFGGMTPTTPLKLNDPAPQSTSLEPFQVTAHPDHYSLAVKLGEDWRLLYRFDLLEQWRVDFEMANWYVCCHPDSKFVHNLMVVRTEPGKRHTLLNGQYALRYPDGRSEKTQIESAPALIELLETVFAINTDGLDRQALEAMLIKKQLVGG